MALEHAPGDAQHERQLSTELGRVERELRVRWLHGQASALVEQADRRLSVEDAEFDFCISGDEPFHTCGDDRFAHRARVETVERHFLLLRPHIV